MGRGPAHGHAGAARDPVGVAVRADHSRVAATALRCFGRTGLVDDVLEHSPRSGAKCSRGWGFARALRSREFDLAVLFPNSFRSAWWAWLSGARRRVGISRNGRGLLLTDRLAAPPTREPVSALDEYWRIAMETLDRIPIEPNGDGESRARVGSGDKCRPVRGSMEAAVLPQDDRLLQRRATDWVGGWANGRGTFV